MIICWIGWSGIFLWVGQYNRCTVYSIFWFYLDWLFPRIGPKWWRTASLIGDISIVLEVCLSLLRRSPLHPLNKITQLRLSECHQLLLQAWEDQRLSTLRWRRKVFIWVANFSKKIKLMVLVSSLPFFSLDSCFL